MTTHKREFKRISDEDAHVLGWCGHMGHKFVAIYGKLNHRRSRAECNNKESAIARFYEDDENRAVYRSVGKRKWELVWTGE